MPGAGKKPLSIFEFPLKTWEEFVAIKLLADLAEILQVEDLLHCTFHPLRNLARATMPEERFHAQFGEDFCGRAGEDAGRQGAAAGGDRRVLPVPAEVLRRLEVEEQRDLPQVGIKQRSNDEMRAGLYGARHRRRRQARPHPARGAAGGVISLLVAPPLQRRIFSCSSEGHERHWSGALPAMRRLLGSLRTEVRSASWFAALGEPLTDGDREEAKIYAWHLRRRAGDVLAERRALPEVTGDARRQASREGFCARNCWQRAEAQHPERAFWTSLTELTTE